MFSNYIISQLTKVTAWLGAFTIIAAFFLPRSFIVVLGLLMIVVPDEKFQKLFSEWSPTIKKALDKK
ncbi:MAG: hypothetical protein LW696_07660 [Alphaproteobacteria bacterium]|jgi:hypothetical protein|nr:hypothetical protein [Alphaproteobacteria bacterium]